MRGKENKKKEYSKKERTEKIEDGSQEDVEFWCERGDKMKMSRKIEIRSWEIKFWKKIKKNGGVFLKKNCILN